LVEYGQQSNAYFNLQKGVSYFDLPGVGFMSFFTGRFPLKRINIVFSRPVCAPKDVPRLLDAYLLQHRHASTIFAGVDAEISALLAERGYGITPLGTDFHVDLPSFDLVGKKKKYLRKAQRVGEPLFEVREQGWAPDLLKNCQEISDAWLTTKRGRGKELRVLTRPPIFAPAWGIRRFFGYDPSGRLLGYVFFDPYFSNGEVAGYTANILRRHPDAPSVFLDYVTLCAADVFAKEGVGKMSLGMSPLHGVAEYEGETTPLRKILQLAYAHGERFYAFQSLAFHKTRWRGEPEVLFAATKDISTLRAVLFTLKICNVV
jgi:lysylphosphatidylglycerol synthetase-like protein (DUF2156 family)